MHELSIADALVKQVEGIVTREGASRTTAITVEVGALSGVDPDALSAAFPFVAEASPAVSQATLQIIQIPATAVCLDCGGSLDILEAPVCPRCGSTRLSAAEGRALNLRSVELEFD
jgi:hydrogenase nickel incorporation protein HypA/HybF